jgi:hypothetical protein
MKLFASPGEIPARSSIGSPVCGAEVDNLHRESGRAPFERRLYGILPYYAARILGSEQVGATSFLGQDYLGGNLNIR